MSMDYEEYYEEEDHFEQEIPSDSAAFPGERKHYEWKLHDGHQWLSIDNDDVLESHYCQPAAKGITIYTASHGKLHIDFDTLKIVNSPMKVQRLTSLPKNQREDVGWYYRDEQSWREYASQDFKVTSKSVEDQFTQNTGTMTFTVGFTNYTLDFSSMSQTNIQTGKSRKVRRRPKFNTGSNVKWEFKGDQGWTEYQSNVCSFDSAAIEAQYQQNQQGQMQFNINRFSYTLDFAQMLQVNDSTKFARKVRRTDDKLQPNSGSASSVQWQFQEDDGKWKDYIKGQQCSISSQDIEQHYQQNQHGNMKFSSRNFSYELDFGAMTQKNLQTDKGRPVRRLKQ